MWHDTNEELHSKFAQLLREKVQDHMRDYIQSLPEGKAITLMICKISKTLISYSLFLKW